MPDRPLDFLKILTVAGLILPNPISAATFFKEAPITLESVKSNDYIYYQTQDGFQIIATNNQKPVVDWKNAYAHLFVGKPNEFKIPHTAISLFNNGIRDFAHDPGLLSKDHQRSATKNIYYQKELHDYRIGISRYAGHTAQDAKIFQWPYNESIQDDQSTLEKKSKSVSIPVLSCIPLMLTGCIFFAGLQLRRNHH